MPPLTATLGLLSPRRSPRLRSLPRELPRTRSSAGLSQCGTTPLWVPPLQNTRGARRIPTADCGSGVPCLDPDREAALLAPSRSRDRDRRGSIHVLSELCWL